MSSEDCLFCKLINGDIKADTVYEDDDVFAFRDINPQAPVHVLIVPKKPIPKLTAADESDMMILGKLVIVAKQIAKDYGLEDDGFRLLLNEGKNGGQTIYHLHFHLLGGRRLMWPPG